MSRADSYYSQFGEDKILSKIFRDKKFGVCVDVGANDGVSGSNSLFFEKIGWTCVLVEPNPVLCEKIRLVRHCIVFSCAASNKNGAAELYVASGAPGADGVSMLSSNEDDAKKRIESFGFNYKKIEVKTVPLDDLLEDAKTNHGIDFVSIDVEGHELDVLRGFDIKKWAPKIIIIEDNSNFSDTSVCDFLKKEGYVRFKRTGVNDWYAFRDNKEFVNFYSKILLWIEYPIARTNLLSKITKIRNLLSRIPFAKKIKRSIFG